MQLADCSLTASPAGDRALQVFSGQNQTAYLRLKLALSLSLRRQIFLAVCDDLALRNRIAARLYAELAYPAPKLLTTDAVPAPQDDSASVISPLDHRLSVIADEHDASTLPRASRPSRLLYPRLVSLNLNLSEPNPMVQIAEWLAEYPPPKGCQPRLRSPGFQILGVERLTRQPAPVQKRFLHSLQQIEHYLSCLESPLLLWLPRPWLNAVQQSAPDFWNWHTALFEFEGDPTPVRSVAVRLVTNNAAPAQTQSFSSEPSDPSYHVSNATTEAFTTTPAADLSLQEPSKENLWDILSHDLALLDAPKQLASEQAVSEQEVSSQSQPLAPTDLDPAAVPAIATVDSEAAITQPTNPTNEAGKLLPVTPAVANSIAVHSAASVLPVVALTDTPTQPPTVSADTPDQSQAALALADLILAVMAEEVGKTPSSQNAIIIQTLQQIEQLHLQQAPKATLLAAYQNLGNLCRDRIEQGEASSQHLLLTVCVYEQTLPWLDDASLLWSDVLNDIGNLYWMLSRQESVVDESLTYLDQAIAAYQQALAKTNPDTRPHNYAMIQNNIGSAYGDMARFRTPAESLEQSVAAYELALRYRPLHDDPARYAATQNNLGTAYWNLAQYQQPVRRLKQAIAAYFEALRYYSPTCEPMHYAMIQNNLGTAYWNLAQQPQVNLGVGTATGKSLSAADLLERAIAAYCAALVYRTLDVAPAAYAATQNNLGTAYWQLATLLESQPDQRHEQLQQAIVAYKAAIAAVEYLTTASTSFPSLSFDPAATHNNLGLAYYQLAIAKHQRDSNTQRSANLEAALHHHLQALQAWQTQPDLYKTVFSYVIQTIRAFHSEFGSKGQSLALSKVPANLLPDVLRQL
ncbi:tetratricopeptide repeat protein [Phormidium sp. FACHB-592]|uniref:Tetratricopeptide repeat protein n=1 Tax=Stenomitos frigidus AS-A4 TaxID=2933935 RepID=A0ABV0KQ61_9CYAN|nr:tetratricopeptide repeat protein [Phormidium sp. FACHB-592]MBD2073453.1 tetratricopeptide repeat protein [Phormidium sp. FACHB-592]